MFNHSEILTAAWKEYRLIRPCTFAAGDVGGKFVFLRSVFVTALRKAWADAKKLAATAQAFNAAQARVSTEKAAALPAAERSLRISQLRDELTLLDYAPLGVRTTTRRRLIGAELETLAA